MKVVVAGLWHLGCVTSACLADLGFNVIGVPEDDGALEKLDQGQLPVYEPGLDEMTSAARNRGLLTYTTDLNVVKEADIIWITYDTPVNDKDEADIYFVENRVTQMFPFLKDESVVLVSSQLPVGTIRKLEQDYIVSFPEQKVHFACFPENLRLGNAIKVFNDPDRIIAGVSSTAARQKLENFLTTISSKIIWVSVPSAEMIKHAVNAFLATSVVFINELAALCERVGADAIEVERGLKSEVRIGPKAYLKAGSAFAGGTLARDLSFLVDKRELVGLPSSFFQSIIQSNQHHRDWYKNKIISLYKNIRGKTITVLGLAYKPGTDTLRRSESIRLCRWLFNEGAIVRAYDPVIKTLPDDLCTIIQLYSNTKDLFEGSDCIVIATECPEFLEINFTQISGQAYKFDILDANGFLNKKFGTSINYYRIGKGDETKK